jgi:hypothetical protein
MDFPVLFDPLKFSYLNIQPIENYYDTQRQITYKASSALDEAEETGRYTNAESTSS